MYKKTIATILVIFLIAVGFPFDTLSEDDPLLQRINQLSTGTII